MTILSNTLHKTLVRAMGLYDDASRGSFPGLLIGIVMASLQPEGKVSLFQI